MGYSQEVVRKARARLAQAKEDRESENRQHLAEAYAKVPRLREIDMQLRRTMAQAAQAAFLQGSDGREQMEKVRQENLSLQREREALAARYFEPGYLDDSPVCSICGGSGYLGTNMCECLRELCRQEQKKEVSILSGSRESFNQFRLDYYPDKFDSRFGASPRTIMERNLEKCRRYALTFTANSGNMLFVRAGVSDISQKGRELLFTLARFEPESLVSLCTLPKYKQRILLGAGEIPRLTLYLRKGEDPLQAALELVEDLKLKMESAGTKED